MRLEGILWPRAADRWGRTISWRFNWGEISTGWGLGLKLHHWHDRDEGRAWSLQIKLIYLQWFVYLPLPDRYKDRDAGGFGDSWGVSWDWDVDLRGADIHLNWGGRYKILHLPWAATWVRTSTLLADGKTWDHETLAKNRQARKLQHTLGSLDSWRERREYLEKNRWERSYPYTYTLKSGEVQKRIATVTIEEREWRWRWLTWLPAMRKARGFWWPGDRPAAPIFGAVRRTISVEFSDEVGERTGSWKGGCTGCGYQMRKGEYPEQTLRRMENERKF